MERLILLIKQALAVWGRAGKAFFRNPVRFVITVFKQLKQNMSEFRPGNFQVLPPVIKNIIIICVLVWLAQIVSMNVFHYPLEMLFALHYWQSEYFRPYQLITHLFMHGGFFHIAFNMFALWMFGSILENIWGPRRFLIFYFVCGIGAALCFLGYQTWEYHKLTEGYLNGQVSALAIQEFLIEPVLGASGAIFGVLVAFGYMFPNSMLYIFPIPVPIKAKWLVIGYVALELYLGLQASPGDNVAHFAHLGGALFGFILMKIWNKGGRRNSY